MNPRTSGPTIDTGHHLDSLFAELRADLAELRVLRDALSVAAPGLSAPDALAMVLARAEPERRAPADAETVRP